MEKKVLLDKTLAYGGVDHAELTVKLQTVGDEEDALQTAISMGRGNNPLAIEMCLLSRMTGVPYDALRTMYNADYGKLRAALNELNGVEPGKPATLTGPGA